MKRQHQIARWLAVGGLSASILGAGAVSCVRADTDRGDYHLYSYDQGVRRHGRVRHRRFRRGYGFYGYPGYPVYPLYPGDFLYPGYPLYPGNYYPGDPGYYGYDHPYVLRPQRHRIIRHHDDRR